jgi:hypothetical protein
VFLSGGELGEAVDEKRDVAEVLHGHDVLEERVALVQHLLLWVYAEPARRAQPEEG